MRKNLSRKTNIIVRDALVKSEIRDTIIFWESSERIQRNGK
jgi:hypothetical protein